jgi:PPOX class probable F420-dependent enzyme
LALTEDQVRLLEQPHVAILATADSSGRPHAAPIWYLFEEGEIIMSTGRDSKKARNIAVNPQVVLVVDEKQPPYYAVMVHGRATIGDPLDAERRSRMAVRYLGEELAQKYLESTSDGDASITLRLLPESVVQYTGRARRSSQ